MVPGGRGFPKGLLSYVSGYVAEDDMPPPLRGGWGLGGAGGAGYLAKSAVFLFSGLRLRYFLCFSAQVSHLVWPSMAWFGHFTHLPDCLASSLFLWCIFLWASWRFRTLLPEAFVGLSVGGYTFPVARLWPGLVGRFGGSRIGAVWGGSCRWVGVRAIFRLLGRGTAVFDVSQEVGLVLLAPGQTVYGGLGTVAAQAHGLGS